MAYLIPQDFHSFNQDPYSKQPMMLPLPIVFEAGERPKWEYHTVTLDPREEPPLDEAGLKELGQEGWLLAGIVGIPAGERVTRITYYFVRYA